MHSSFVIKCWRKGKKEKKEKRSVSSNSHAVLQRAVIFCTYGRSGHSHFKLFQREGLVMLI